MSRNFKHILHISMFLVGLIAGSYGYMKENDKKYNDKIIDYVLSGESKFSKYGCGSDKEMHVTIMKEGLANIIAKEIVESNLIPDLHRKLIYNSCSIPKTIPVSDKKAKNEYMKCTNGVFKYVDPLRENKNIEQCPDCRDSYKIHCIQKDGDNVKTIYISPVEEIKKVSSKDAKIIESKNIGKISVNRISKAIRKQKKSSTSDKEIKTQKKCKSCENGKKLCKCANNKKQCKCDYSKGPCKCNCKKNCRGRNKYPQNTFPINDNGQSHNDNGYNCYSRDSNQNYDHHPEYRYCDEHSMVEKIFQNDHYNSFVIPEKAISTQCGSNYTIVEHVNIVPRKERTCN